LQADILPEEAARGAAVELQQLARNLGGTRVQLAPVKIYYCQDVNSKNIGKIRQIFASNKIKVLTLFKILKKFLNSFRESDNFEIRNRSLRFFEKYFGFRKTSVPDPDPN
jgi:hypothetical protein